MSIFVLKIIACITMVLDHVKYAIPETQNFLTIYGGRVAFPLFAFLLTEGYVHTKNLKKYYIRILIFALISQIPFMLFRTLVGEYMLLNIMFTLLLGLISITIYEKINKKYLSIPLIILIIYLGEVLNVDYGWFGVAIIFVMYLFRNNKLYLTIALGILITIFYYSIGLLNKINFNVISYWSCNFVVPMICIWSYNGKLGRKIKYWFYWFYPIHMMLIYLISLI